MKRFLSRMLLSLFLGYVFLGGTACVKKIFFPSPSPPAEKKEESSPTDPKKISKQKNKYLAKISQLRMKYKELDAKRLAKREGGYNTTEAEKTLEAADKALAMVEGLVFWYPDVHPQNGRRVTLSEIENTLKEINLLFEQAKKQISKAPLFGDQSLKKEKKVRKYMDDRDMVAEIMGEPDPKNVQARAPLRLELNLLDPTTAVTQSQCWSNQTRTFSLVHPPGVIVWYYPTVQKMIVFMETNSVIEQFMLRNELPSAERDGLLSQLCIAQVYGGYRVIYAGPPITDAYQIMEQVFTGRGRTVDMFGVGALERLAKATAALPDLAVASLAFSTQLYKLNDDQDHLGNKFCDLIPQIDPQLAAFLKKSEEIKNSSESQNKKDKDTKALLKTLDLKAKKRLEAINKILKWQQTLNPSENDIKGLVKAFPDFQKEIEEVCYPFRETLLSLQNEFTLIRENLLKFQVHFPELVFEGDDYIVIFFMVEGVRFEPKFLPDGRSFEEPDLSLKVVIKVRQGKKEEPVFIGESKEIKVTTANRYIDEIKDYRRLTSFGLVFPFNLKPGFYEVTLIINDNLRVQAIEQRLNWTIISDFDTDGLVIK